MLEQENISEITKFDLILSKNVCRSIDNVSLCIHFTIMLQYFARIPPIMDRDPWANSQQKGTKSNGSSKNFTNSHTERTVHKYIPLMTIGL